MVRILLIDPDDRLATEYLASEYRPNPFHPSWQFDRAQTLEQALDLISTHPYNLAIIEMMLPDASGIDAWERIYTSHPEMFGILTTSSRVLHTSISPSEKGILAFLLKPLRRDTVLHFIVQGLQLQGLGAENSRFLGHLVGLNMLLTNIIQAPTLGETIDATLAHFDAAVCADWLVLLMLNGYAHGVSRLQIRPLSADLPQLDSSQQQVIHGMMDQVIRVRPTIFAVASGNHASGYFGALPEEVGLGALLITPLVAREQTYGALAIVNRIDSEQVFTQNEIQLLNIVSQVLAFKMGFADQMTKVPAL